MKAIATLMPAAVLWVAVHADGSVGPSAQVAQ